MAKISQITAREIFDSRGNPTVEAKVTLDDGTESSSSVPSGASIGTHEAVEIRDQDPARYNGMGVLKAVDNVNTQIAGALAGMEATEQSNIDRAMINLDGTPGKSKLGANAILSASQAVTKAAAKSSGLTLSAYIRQFVTSDQPIRIPMPIFNMVEGGKHAGSVLDFQEFLVIPASSKNFSEAFTIGATIYRTLKKILEERGLSTLVADEGGFSPDIGNNRAAVTFLKEAIDASGVAYSLDVFMGLDVAATSFHDGKTYRLIDRSTPYSDQDLIAYYQELFTDYSLIYIEDPFAENDIEGWKKMYTVLGEKTLIVGDDLVTTNPYRLGLALENQLVGGVVIKPNQIGSVSEAIAVAEIARFKGLKTIVSHRSGETEDSFIADFAVGIGADYIKFGAPARERMVKYNRLLQIEKEIST